MTKNIVYRYLGRNGIITSPILLEGNAPIEMYRLIADENKALTNGEIVVKMIDVFAEDLGKWTEIDDGQ